MEFSKEELLRQIIAETQKGVAPLVEALAEIEREKRPKDYVEPATREELNAVIASLDFGGQPIPKPESEKTAEEKETEAMLDRIMSYM